MKKKSFQNHCTCVYTQNPFFSPRNKNRLLSKWKKKLLETWQINTYISHWNMTTNFYHLSSSFKWWYQFFFKYPSRIQAESRMKKKFMWLWNNNQNKHFIKIYISNASARIKFDNLFSFFMVRINTFVPVELLDTHFVTKIGTFIFFSCRWSTGWFWMEKFFKFCRRIRTNEWMNGRKNFKNKELMIQLECNYHHHIWLVYIFFFYSSSFSPSFYQMDIIHSDTKK